MNSSTVVLLMLGALYSLQPPENEARAVWLERGISRTLHLGLRTFVGVFTLFIDEGKPTLVLLPNHKFQRERSRGNKYDVCSCLHYC